MMRILIADDHQVIIDGLKLLLSHEENFEIVGEAIDGNQVMTLLTKVQVDVILLDINMPNLDGIEATKMIRAKYPHVKILVLTMYNRSEFIKNLIEAGASGYVLKNIGRADLIDAIKKVSRGEDYFSAEVTKTIMSSLKAGGGKGTGLLTDREKDVLRLVADGCTTVEIAEKLFIATNTVDTHRKNLLSKLQQKNTAELVRYAVENGFTKPRY